MRTGLPAALAALLPALLFTAACTVGPRYARPLTPMTPVFKELPPGNDQWKASTPRDGELKGKWWEIYNDPQLNALSAFVLKLTTQNEASLMSAPDFAVQGASIYEANHCGACHQINGAGQKLGPPLDGVGQHRDRAWLEQHFKDPKSTSPGSIMPPYKCEPQEMDAIVKYLLQLPKAGG